MSRKIGVTVGEMMQLREQGLSNKDIAHVLEISVASVQRYIGPQGKRMESLAAFKNSKPKKEARESMEVETPEIKRAVDEIVVREEIISSKSGNVKAIINYTDCTVILGDETILRFDELPEFATFIVGMVERIRARG